MNDATTPVVRRLAITLAVLTAASIAVAAFILSFSALWDVATRVWPNRHLSWLGPAVVDSTILQATVSLIVVTNGVGKGERRYFWSLLIGAAATSVAGNALHAVVPHSAPLPGAVAAVIATIPPVFLLLSTHSLTLLIRRRPTPPTAAPAAGDSQTYAPDAEASTPGGQEPAPGAGEWVDRDDAQAFIEVARMLREENDFATPASQIAALLQRYSAHPDASWRELGVAGMVHHNTAKKIVDAFLDRQLVSNTRS